MAKNDYTKMILAQIEAFLATSTETLGEDHPTVLILTDTVERLNETALVTKPDGFADDDQFEEFIASQAQVFEDTMSENTLLTSVDDVVGEITDENGQTVVIGNVEESAAKVDEILEQIEAEEGEIQVSDIMRITYERQDQQTLTAEDVDMILAHPASRALKNMGNMTLLTIEDTDSDARKTAIFALENDGPISKKAIATQIVAYRGVLPFPRLGSVSCTSSVAFADGEVY